MFFSNLSQHPLNQNEKYYISLSLNLYVADNNKLHQKDEPPDNAKSEYEKYYHHCAVYSYRHMGISGEYHFLSYISHEYSNPDSETKHLLLKNGLSLHAFYKELFHLYFVYNIIH